MILDKFFFFVLGNIFLKDEARIVRMALINSLLREDSKRYKCSVLLFQLSLVFSKSITPCHWWISWPPPLSTRKKKLMLQEKSAFKIICKLVSVVPKTHKKNPQMLNFLEDQPYLIPSKGTPCSTISKGTSKFQSYIQGITSCYSPRVS